MIISKVGPLTEEDMSFLSASKQTQYLKQFDVDHAATPIESIITWADPVALDLCKKMLQFNPYLIISIEECLQHPYFDDLETDSDEEEAPTFDLDKMRVNFDDCKEPELREILEETFRHFNEHRDANFGC